MSSASTTGHVRIDYQPALDGVRALAVVAVLLLHAAVPGFDGGYLGVSVFFTLSGFLITSLLLREHATTGRIDVAAFYGRRIRRLLPASLVTVAVVAVVAAATDVFDGVVGLRDHVLGAIFQVANWVFLAGSGSYQDLLADTSGTPSPLEHFWSLAIEEQFYWVWPLVMVVLLGRTAGPGGWRRRMTLIVSLTAVSMVAAPVIAQVWGPDAAYWATPARLSEILVGALLAFVVERRAIGGVAFDPRIGALAPLALLVLGAAVVLFPAASGPAYEGALPLVAVASGALLSGLQVDGPLRQAMAIGPLVWLGRISYGVYLFHWPVYVIVDDDRLGTGGPLLVLTRLAITLAVAVVSYVVIEQPVRRARRLRFGAVVGGSALAMGVVAVVAVVIVPASAGNYWELDDSVVDAAAITTDGAPLTLAPTTTTIAATTTSAPASSQAATTVPDSTVPDSTVPVSTVPPTLAPLPELGRPVRIVVTGDSTGEALGAGVVRWAAAHPDLAQAAEAAAPGCGIVTGGERRRGDGVESDEGCVGWVAADLLPVIAETAPDVVLVMVTTWDVIGRRWDDGDLLAPSDPEYRARIEHDYAAFVDQMRAAGVGHVAFVRQPVPNVWWLPTVQEEDEPARHQVIYDTYDELAAADPGFVTVIDLATWFGDDGLALDQDVRPDGVHLAPEAAEMVMSEFLGDRVIRAALGMPVS